MQTETASSTTKAELIALRKWQKTTIRRIGLMEEMREQVVGMISIQAEIKCKVFEDNLYP